MNNKYLYFGKKKYEYYSDLLIRADTGLHEQIAQTLAKKVKKGESVLDMGAGQGALAARLHDLGYKVTAVDVNDEDYLIQERDIQFKHVNFDDEYELEKFIANHESQFDVVCGVEVIEHVENPWNYVRGLARLVKPGGLVLITTPNTTSWLSRLYFLISGTFLCFQEQNLSYGHINPIAAFELNLIMNRTGLNNVKIESAGTLPPLYFAGVRVVLFSLLAILIRPIQSGKLNGWCVIATGTK
jgi:2-polyprenyl-3-methyl-5-hydroxy-6-metoxy-1,4-benzoquinol methylase